jgi:carboxylesterase
VSAFLSLAILATAWAVARAVIARREERRFESVYARDADGIIVGAASIRLAGPREGAVLLLHGYNDSPQSVASVAATFHARGWTVWAPLLPGHGRTLQAFARSGAAQWLDGARRELADLRATHSSVAVAGLSMGGAIAFVLAAEDPQVAAVVAFAPYLDVSWPLRLLEVVAPIATLGARYLSSGGSRSVHDRAAGERMIAYRRSTPRLLVQLDHVARLAFRSLPRVQTRVLVVQSREDNRIPVRAALRAYARIGSKDKALHWVTGSGHVVTVDYGHTSIEQFAADWLEPRLI